MLLCEQPRLASGTGIRAVRNGKAWSGGKMASQSVAAALVGFGQAIMESMLAAHDPGSGVGRSGHDERNDRDPAQYGHLFHHIAARRAGGNLLRQGYPL